METAFFVCVCVFRIVHGDSLWAATCVVWRPFSVICWICWNKKYMLDMLKLLKFPLVVRTVLINWTSVQSGYNEFSIGIKSLPMPCWSHETCNSDDEHRQHGKEQQECLSRWPSVFPKEDDTPKCAYKGQRLIMEHQITVARNCWSCDGCEREYLDCISSRVPSSLAAHELKTVPKTTEQPC